MNSSEWTLLPKPFHPILNNGLTNQNGMSATQIFHRKRDNTMQRIEFHANISENGVISLPPQIRKQLLLKPDQVVKVTVEAQQLPEKPAQHYSFGKVRKLLKSVKGDLSAEILADREDRI